MIGYLKQFIPARLYTTISYWIAKWRCEKLSVGKNCTIVRSSFGRVVNVDDDVAVHNSHVGDYTYIGPRSVICDTQLGKFCSIAPESYIGMGTHPTGSFVSTHPIFYLSKPRRNWSIVDKDHLAQFSPTKIGNDVWIGVRAAVKDGINIGDGAIIGAGAIVTKDVPPYAIYVGVPAKLMRYRFSEEQINFLLSFKWWDKDDKWFRANYKKLHDIEELMREYA